MTHIHNAAVLHYNLYAKYHLKPGDISVYRIIVPVIVKCLKLECKTAALATPATSSPAPAPTPTPATILPTILLILLVMLHKQRVVSILTSPPR